MATGTPAAELRELSEDELVTRLRESKEELFNLRFQMLPARWTTTDDCAPFVTRSRASTPSCVSVSSDSLWVRMQVTRHE